MNARFPSDDVSTVGQPPVGIDLGTTYSAIAHLDTSGRPVTIPNGSGDLLTASALLFDEDEIVIGREASKSSVINPEVYAECFKRDMGDMNYHQRVRGIDVPPEVLSGFVLQRLKQDAEKRIGVVRDVVITVPAFFDETRRKATQDAGRLAGLNILDIINEPTAAAVAYGYQKGFLNFAAPSRDVHRVLVYDLGGGTFDVTILEIADAQFRALGTDGDVRLGGKDFDERLVNHLAEQFIAEHGVDPRADPHDAAQLWLDAQEAKHTLSERTKTTVVCFHAGLRLRVEVTRDLFEDLTRDLLERTETTTSLLVKQLGLTWPDIDQVLLVGGSSRMPMVVRMLESIAGKAPDQSQSPDEAVAHGAAYYCAMLMDRDVGEDNRQCELVNINSHSLGVVAMHRKSRTRQVVTLIPKNTALPARAARAFKTAEADQRDVVVNVVEGESHRPEDCIALGECIIQDLPSGLPKETLVHVEYSYAANGRISVSARIPSIRQSAHAEIKRRRTHDLLDLESWRKRLLGMEAVGRSKLAMAAAEQQRVDPTDRASVMKRLDHLYARLGKAAVAHALPEALARSQQAVSVTFAEAQAAEEELRQLETQAATAISASQRIQANAELARSKSRLDTARSKHDFACVVLGRECAAAGSIPQGHERLIQEIKVLSEHMSTVGQ